MPTQKELFIELANPNENGISRWVNTLEFINRHLAKLIGNDGFSLVKW